MKCIGHCKCAHLKIEVFLDCTDFKGRIVVFHILIKLPVTCYWAPVAIERHLNSRNFTLQVYSGNRSSDSNTKASPDVWAYFETTQNLWLYRPLERFRTEPNFPCLWATFLPNSFTCADQVSSISTVTSRSRALSFYCIGAQSNWTALSLRNVREILSYSLIGNIIRLQTKRRPLYLKTQSVPLCKHFSSRL